MLIKKPVKKSAYYNKSVFLFEVFSFGRDKLFGTSQKSRRPDSVKFARPAAAAAPGAACLYQSCTSSINHAQIQPVKAIALIQEDKLSGNSKYTEVP